MSLKHSERAKAGTRLPLKLRTDTIKQRIASIEAEIKLYTGYLKYQGLNKKWIRTVIASNKKKLAKRKATLKVYEARWTDYKKRGLI
jgi:uncharacterized protein (UPF0335 family)